MSSWDPDEVDYSGPDEEEEEQHRPTTLEDGIWEYHPDQIVTGHPEPSWIVRYPHGGIDTLPMPAYPDGAAFKDGPAHYEVAPDCTRTATLSSNSEVVYHYRWSDHFSVRTRPAYTIEDLPKVDKRVVAAHFFRKQGKPLKDGMR